MGKYDGVIKNLRRAAFAGEPRFEEVVAAKKAELEIAGLRGDPTKLAAAYVEARAAKEAHEAAAAPLNVALAAIERLLWDAYEDADIQAIKVGTGATVRIQPEPYTAVIDPGALRQWAIDNGHAASLALPWQTTNALAKAALLGEGKMPDGVDVTIRMKTVMQKG